MSTTFPRSIALTPTDQDNVKVCVRCRPLNSKEIKLNLSNVIEFDKSNSLVRVRKDETLKEFSFDHVFDHSATQLEVYTKSAHHIVEQCLEGYNGTIFAYGQTGTGKTFTMEGQKEPNEKKGIIYNSFAHIFGSIAKNNSDKKFLVRISYLQIYNEEVRDLLVSDSKKKLDVKERPDVGVYVKDLSLHVVHSPSQMEDYFIHGNKNRIVGSTKINELSSRSHAIYTIIIERSQDLGDNQYSLISGKLHLVDLAGSERQSKSGASGQRLLEANKINLSLTTLGNVISSLVDKNSKHTPYRNSKLTRLLQDSLGGNSKTVMIANISPTIHDLEETLSTLRYAYRAKSIQNKARINLDPKDAILLEYKNEIENLRRQLRDQASIVSVDGIDESQRIIELKRNLEENRRLFEMDKDMVQAEKNRILQIVHEQERELEEAKNLKRRIGEKINELENQIIIGGENLLDKAEEQENLLAESAAKMIEQIDRAKNLQGQLKEKENLRFNFEQKYNSLQEELDGKKSMLNHLAGEYIKVKNDYDDLQAEHARQMDLNNDNITQTKKELDMLSFIVDQCIPKKYQNCILENVKWNTEIGEWQLRCIAFTGNNIDVSSQSEDGDQLDDQHETRAPLLNPITDIYPSYTDYICEYKIVNSK